MALSSSALKARAKQVYSCDASVLRYLVKTNGNVESLKKRRLFSKE